MTRRSKDNDIIKALAALVRNNEEKLLSGENKLSLTTSVLNYLNDCLTKYGICKPISNSGPTSSNQNDHGNEMYQQNKEDLQFLYEFICRTKSVKLSHGTFTLQGQVDLSKFSQLEHLEIKKCPIHLVTGLQVLRQQIQTLTCSRCIQSVEDIFRSCGGDRTSPFTWKELHTVNLSFNMIEELDDSLCYLPSVKILDLSHNQIQDTANHLECFWKLIALNLGFNLLTSIPLLNTFTRPKLRTLILKNNNLDSLKGLELFINLQELDLSNNCLDEYTVLEPLNSLHQLNRLNLTGNPLAYHYNHRLLAMNMLHQEAVNQKFILDLIFLSEAEILFVAKRKERWQSDQTIIQPSEITSENIDSPLLNHHSINSVVVQTSELNNAQNSDLLNTKNSNSLKLNKKPRAVTIVDQPEDDVSKVKITFLDKDLPNSFDHLKTKEESERYREYLGHDWLIAATKNQNEMASITVHSPPPPPPPAADKIGSIDAIQSVNENKNIENTLKSDSSRTLVTPVTESDNVAILGKDNVPSMSYDQPFEDTVAKMELYHKTHFPENLRLDLSTELESSLSDEVPMSPLSPFETDSSDEETLIGDESQPFVVQLVKDENAKEHVTLFLSIIGHYLLEKDWNARIVEQLDLKSLLKVDRIASENEEDGPSLLLKFNYVKKDRRKRNYIMESDEECKSLMDLLVQFLKVADGNGDNGTKYQCLKCSKNFSHRETKTIVKMNKIISMSLDSGHDFLQEILICPSCGSEHIFTHDDEDEQQKTVNFGSVPTNSFLTSAVESSSDSALQKQKTPLSTSPYLYNYSNSFVTSQETSESRSAYLSISQGRYDSILSTSPSIYPLGGKAIGSTLSRTLLNNSFAGENHEHSNPVISLKEEIERAEMSALAAAAAIASSISSNKRKISSDRNSEPSLRIAFKDPSMKRSESDITILSNPSQSSISVLTNPSQEGLMALSEETLENSEFVSGLGHLNASPILDRSISVDEGVTLLSRPNKCVINMSPQRDTGGGSSNESSDSSVCTAYESHAIEEEQITSENDATPTDDLSPWIVGGDPSFEDIDESNSESGEKVPTSPVQIQTDKNILNTVLQTPTPVTSASSLGIQYCFEDFMNIDHRLKLYFDMSVVKNNEEVVGLLKAGIVQFKKNDEFVGLLLLSTTNIYIFKILGEENDQMERWLQKVDQQPVSALQSISTGYGDQNFVLSFGSDGPSYNILLRDTKRCSRFLDHFHRVMRKTSNRTSTQLNQDILNNIKLQVLPSGAEEQFNIIFYHMGYQKVKNEGKTLLEPVSIFVIDDTILLTRENHQWALQRLQFTTVSKIQQFDLLQRQAINNITAIDLYQDACNECCLRFFDEDNGSESSWWIVMETESAQKKLILALKEPWEREFAVEQPLTLHFSVTVQDEG